MTVKEAVEALEVALKTVDGDRVYRDPGANVHPPGTVLGPPVLNWEAYCVEPTSITLPVFVIEKESKRVLERLWERVPEVAAAIEAGVPNAVTTGAEPGTYRVGQEDLPCYQINVEVSL